MRTEAVIFDKDGTLLDFDAFWVSVSVSAIRELLVRFGREEIPTEAFLSAFGVTDGVTDIDGVLCKGTYEEMGEVAHGVLSAYGCAATRKDVIAALNEAYKKNTASGTVKPTDPRLAETLTELKSRGIRLAVVTTDNTYITRKSLESLGVWELFDAVYTDDGHTPTKPDPFCAEDLCRRFGLSKEGVVMVGDTMTDVRFAKNAGIRVFALAKDEKCRARLSPYADAVVEKLSEIPDLL